MSTLINTQGIGDLYQLYLLSQRDGIDFNAAYIPQSFSDRLDRPFDTAYMRNLYALGSQDMLESKAWHKTPPGYDPTPFHSILQSALKRRFDFCSRLPVPKRVMSFMDQGKPK